MEQFFDTIAGLPVHPLVVHATVVLLPLSALGIIASTLSRWIRTRFAGVSLIGLGLSAATAFVAKESGEQLAQRVGEPLIHLTWGGYLWPTAIGTFVVAAVWYVAQRGPTKRGESSIVGNILGAIAVIACLASVVLTVLAGHSGASAVWAGKMTPLPAVTPSPSATASSSGSTATPTAQKATTKSYSMAEVATHNSQDSCWTVIDGSVYNVTPWISQHPGGSDRILGLCGKDATDQFTAQHSTTEKAKAQLATFLIGRLT